MSLSCPPFCRRRLSLSRTQRFGPWPRAAQRPAVRIQPVFDPRPPPSPPWGGSCSEPVCPFVSAVQVPERPTPRRAAAAPAAQAALCVWRQRCVATRTRGGRTCLRSYSRVHSQHADATWPDGSMVRWFGSDHRQPRRGDGCEQTLAAAARRRSWVRMGRQANRTGCGGGGAGRRIGALPRNSTSVCASSHKTPRLVCFDQSGETRLVC